MKSDVSLTTITNIYHQFNKYRFRREMLNVESDKVTHFIENSRCSWGLGPLLHQTKNKNQKRKGKKRENSCYFTSAVVNIEQPTSLVNKSNPSIHLDRTNFKPRPNWIGRSTLDLKTRFPPYRLHPIISNSQ